LDHATLDELVSGHDPDEPITLQVWLDDQEDEPNYRLELGRVEGQWGVTREDVRFGNFAFSSEQPFTFSTERRGEVALATPSYPPRHATLPFLVGAYRSDRAAAADIRPILAVREAIGYAYVYRVNPADLVSPVLPPWINADQPYVDVTGAGFPHALQRWAQTIEGAQVFRQQ